MLFSPGSLLSNSTVPEKAQILLQMLLIYKHKLFKMDWICVGYYPNLKLAEIDYAINLKSRDIKHGDEDSQITVWSEHHSVSDFHHDSPSYRHTN